MSSYESLQLQYVEYIKDIKSLPPGISTRKKIEEKLSLFLKDIYKNYGQDMVDRITGKQDKPRLNTPKKEKPNNVCAFPECKNLGASRGKYKRHKWCVFHRQKGGREARIQLDKK